MNKRAKLQSIEDNPEWKVEDFKRAVPVSGLPRTLHAKLRGRPPKESPKVAVKLRLDSDLLAVLKATGPGWQTRANRILRERFAL